MTIYFVYIAAVILVGWYLLGDKITRTQKTNCMLGVALFLILMMSLRYQIGYDYVSYDEIYSNVLRQSWGEIIPSYGLESGFYLFVKAVSSIGFGYQQFLFVCNIIMVGCVLFTIYDHSPIWWVSCVLYMTLQFVPYSMNLLRQAMAVSVIFAAWGFMKKGKWLPYCLIVLLASTIHLSAIVMLPAYFILRLPFNLPVLATYGGAALVGYLIFTPLLKWGVTVFPKYSIYLNHEIYAQQNSFGSVWLPLLYCLVVMLHAKKLIARDKSNSILVYSAFVSFFFSLMITQMYIVERFSTYFFIFSLIALPEIIMVYKAPFDAQDEATKQQQVKQWKKRGLPEHNYITVLILTFSILFLLWNARAGAHKCYPYVGVWEPQNAVHNQEYYEAH